MASQRSVEEMAREINAAGWRINNLFQFDDGGWRCNLRRKTTPRTPGEPSSWAHEFCDGPTMADAMAGAIRDMRQPRNNEKVSRGLKPLMTTVEAINKAIEDSGL